MTPPCLHQHPVTPPRGSMARPGDCTNCGTSYDQARAERGEPTSEGDTRMRPESDHQPESWFHEIGSDACPHGAEPDDDSPEWEAWYDLTSVRHTGSAQDVRVCLDAPAGEACGACSEDDNEFVPWEACRIRDRARRDELPAAEQPIPHRPVTVHVGTSDCLERECEEYYTEDGDEIPGKEHCSHLRVEEICEACSEAPADDGEYPTVVAWADCVQRGAKAGAAA